MSNYRVAVEHGVSLGSLTVIDPQPRSEGVKPLSRSFGLGGTVWDQAYFCELIFDFLESPAQVEDVYTLFGIFDSKESDITLYAPDDRYVYQRYNGKVTRPIPSWNNFFPRSVIITARDLKVII